jgi:hypothetical protein
MNSAEEPTIHNFECYEVMMSENNIFDKNIYVCFIKKDNQRNCFKINLDEI